MRKKISVGLVSLGCAKNVVDLQLLAGRLLKADCVLAPNPDCCDLLVVNTCAFIESAREEARREIARAIALKRAGAVGRILVAGCYPQRYGAAAVAEFPEVDEWDGVPQSFSKPAVPGLRLTGKAFAYLKIAEGCAHRCSYCAIPAIRGRYRSRRPEDIVAEAKSLLATGVRELDVIAQDPMLYGVDLRAAKNRSRPNLVSLLKRLDRLPGDFWVRVLYSYPSEITDEYLEWMRTSPHACRYVDVPIQHTHPAVLKAMARGTAAKATPEADARIRAAVPGVTLRTTVMTGFPGETPARFARLLRDIEAMRFDHLGAFAFSPEEGTAAAKMKGRPAAAVAERRRAEVMRVQKRVWAEKAKLFKGHTLRALVVAPGVARLESQAPDADGVTRIVGGDAPVGEFVDVCITAVRGYDFEAKFLL